MNMNTLFFLILNGINLFCYIKADDACIDERKDCTTLQAYGWCKTRARIMQLKCGKTCGLCGKVITPPTTAPRQKISVNTCQNLRTHCSIYKEAGWCTKKKTTMLKLCAPTCGFCKEGEEMVEVTIATTTTTTTVSKSKACSDKRPDCYKLANVYKWCEQKKSAMQTLCAKSCNFCSTSSKHVTKPTKKATTPTITTTTTTTTTTTRKRERPVVNSRDCKDIRSDCATLAANGWCLSKPTAMAKACPQTCKFCKNIVKPEVKLPREITRAPPVKVVDKNPGVCKDVMPGCSFMFSRGWCTRKKDQMINKCKKTCKFCDACTDYREDCFEYKTNGWCETKRDQMVNVCAKTCNLCNNIPTVAKPTPKACVDKRTNCFKMKKIGFCSSRRKIMTDYCPATCGFCHDSNPNKISTTKKPQVKATLKPRVPGCKDIFDSKRCQYYSHIGWCTKYDRIKKNCQDTCVCNFVPPKGLPTSQTCNESDNGCCWDKKTTKRDADGSNCPACYDDKRFTRLCSRFGGDCNGSGGLAKSLHKYCPKTCKLC